MFPNNEILLHHIVSSIGFDTNKLGVLTNEKKSTTRSFDLYNEKGFYPVL